VLWFLTMFFLYEVEQLSFLMEYWWCLFNSCSIHHQLSIVSLTIPLSIGHSWSRACSDGVMFLYLRYVVFASICTAASCTTIRSLGLFFEQDTPSPITESRQSSVLLLTKTALEASLPCGSSCSKIAGSATSMAL